MKKLIYLPLTAIIVLTGCKGNSFITQRYTKFHHSSQKKSNEDKLVVKEYVKTATINKEVIVTEQTKEVLICAVDLKENKSIPIPTNQNFNAVTKKARVQNINFTSTSVNTLEVKNSEQKKTYIKNTKVAKDLVGWALNLVITAISIVIVIIIVLIILAVL